METTDFFSRDDWEAGRSRFNVHDDGEVNLAGGSAPLSGQSRDLSLLSPKATMLIKVKASECVPHQTLERVPLTRFCRSIADPDGQRGTFRFTIAKHFTANRDPLDHTD